MVFTQSLTTTYAVNASTGQVIWTCPASLGAAADGTMGSIVKIDNTYMMDGSNCVYIANGTTVWTAAPEFRVTIEANSWSGGVNYVPELKMFLSATYGWSLPDPSEPPIMVWNRTADIDAGCTWGNWAYYGNGTVFYCDGDGQLHALDAKTGNQIWQTATTEASGWIYGAVYYNGLLIHGDLQDKMDAWNASTGQLVWVYNPGSSYGFWASAPALWDGIVYEQNQDTYTYAINATTGQLIWRYKGPGVSYGGELAVADGKVYFQSGEAQYRDPFTGVYGRSETVCLNAYNGNLIWSLPIETGCPYNALIVAYGNIYTIPNTTPQVPGSYSYSILGTGSSNELWCIGNQVTDWPMFLGSPSHNTIGYGPTNLTLLWKFPTDDQIFSSPTCANGIVYFGGLDHNIYAVNANTGAEIWNFTTGFAARSSVAVVDGRLYTGTDDGNIYCLDAATGTQIWKTYAGGVTNSLLGGGLVNIRSSPMVVNGKVYVGALDGNLYCLDANTGNVLWTYQTGGPVQSTPTIDGNAVYVTSCTQPTNGTVYKLDASTGSVIWSLSIPYELTATPGEGNFLLASPTVAPDLGMIFVRNGLLDNYGINATTGAIIWTFQSRSNPGAASVGQFGGVIQIDSPLYVDGLLYMNNYYSIDCVNASDGTTVWSTYMSREDISGGITYAPGRVYVVTEVRCVYVLDAVTGAKLSYYVTNGQMRSAPVPYDGNLYVGCSDWNLYCFGNAQSDAASSSSSATSVASSSVSSLQAQAPSTITAETLAAASTPTIAYVILIVTVAIIAAAVLIFRKRK
jgi:outer membrane protein assembly factor BamB